MKLIEIIDNLDNINDDQMIFVASNEPLHEEMEAAMVSIQKNIETGETPNGMDYFLEIHIAKEVITVWENWRKGRKPTLSEKYQAIVYYVMMDAYMPLE